MFIAEYPKVYKKQSKRKNSTYDSTTQVPFLMLKKKKKSMFIFLHIYKHFFFFVFRNLI